MQRSRPGWRRNDLLKPGSESTYEPSKSSNCVHMTIFICNNHPPGDQAVHGSDVPAQPPARQLSHLGGRPWHDHQGRISNKRGRPGCGGGPGSPHWPGSCPGCLLLCLPCFHPLDQVLFHILLSDLPCCACLIDLSRRKGRSSQSIYNMSSLHCRSEFLEKTDLGPKRETHFSFPGARRVQADDKQVGKALFLVSHHLKNLSPGAAA